MRSYQLLILFAAGFHAAATTSAGTRPNIIFILSDDLGYGDYSISDQVTANSTRIPTPNVARLAKNGMKFSRGYSGQVCAPSRTMLMTGLHLGHTTIRGNDGAYTPLLATDTTVAKVLQTAGYTTGLIGKWGLGNFGTTGYPNAQGFDHFLGQDTQVGCHDWFPLTVCNDTVHDAPLNTKDELAYVECLGPNAKCTWTNDLDRTAGVAFIRNAHAKAKPFFLYLSSTTPHAGALSGMGPTPPHYSSYNPVPYPYNTKFLNESTSSGGTWSDKELQFASAVWAQDVIVGAVLDELEALSIEKNTVVFFSGDNGPDIPAMLFDDAGFFRGKKRSLHEGGIRQTIVVQWVGMIAPNSVSNDMFVFYDLLPTAAELAGVDKSSWPATDGLSAVPIFDASRANRTTKLESTSASANRFLYYEFCHNGMVDGLLKQSYASGWGQAVRFDDNTTQYETQWKAIAVNSLYTNILLYNITADRSESVPLAGTVHPRGELAAPADDARDPPQYPPVVANALAHATQLFHAQHVEDPYWKSSKNASDRCCASCFSPGGCNYPCKKFPGAPTPPPSPAPPSPPIALSALVGDWNVNDGGGSVVFTLSVNSSSGKDIVTIRNPGDKTSCWKTGTGGWDDQANAITNIFATGPGCVRNATGVVKVRKVRSVNLRLLSLAPFLTSLTASLTSLTASLTPLAPSHRSRR
jgi:uncharacterized sulfatase